MATFMTMKKYSEQLLMLGLAAVFYFSSASAPVPYSKEASVAATAVQWPLSADKLRGDTVIHIPFDPFFKTAKTYRAFPLRENLKEMMKEHKITGDMQVIFHCTDGYKPHMPLHQVLASNGFLAYADASLPEGKSWTDSLEKKLSPFYLIWPEEHGQDKTFATPYGLASIELQSASVEFSAALPKDEAQLKGFELFSNTCMRCHSLNKMGGSMAPELNYPKNITEYWTKENIWAFVQEPSSFRYNAKMPSMKGMIDREEFEMIYDYLVAMKDTK